MSQLPDYVASAKPNPLSNRINWLTTTAAMYAGVMLWFVFWEGIPTGGQPVLGGVLTQGLGLAVAALIVAALINHFLFFLVPGLLGMKTGFTLAVVGTSTFGVRGGYFMPGLLMGLLQLGWLSVSAYFSGLLLASLVSGQELPVVRDAALLTNVGMLRAGIAIVWIVVATLVGMKGAKYVGMLASFVPFIPIAVLLLLLVSTVGGIGKFNRETLIEGPQKAMVAWEKIAEENSGSKAIQETAANAKKFTEAKPVTLFGNQTLGVFSLILTYVIGFFATAGAAGVDIGSNNKNGRAIQFGGLVGIVLSTCITGIIAFVAVVGSQHALPDHLLATYNVTALFEPIFQNKTIVFLSMLLLALVAFPSSCFPALLSANAFRITFPKVNLNVSCGVGVLVACFLAVSGLAGQAGDVFVVIGASFGPICGAMAADYLLAGRKWAGPRDGFNLPGWVAWFFGFIVGGITLVVEKFLGMTMPFEIPCPPLSAFLVGFILYVLLAKSGFESKVLDMPQRIDTD